MAYGMVVPLSDARQMMFLFSLYVSPWSNDHALVCACPVKATVVG
jgi:hypothetical protein